MDNFPWNSPDSTELGDIDGFGHLTDSRSHLHDFPVFPGEESVMPVAQGAL
jgi:hypothetical protein